MGNEKHKFGWVWKGGADLGRAATHSRQVIKTYMEFLKEPPLLKLSVFIQPFLPSDATQTTPPLSLFLSVFLSSKLPQKWPLRVKETDERLRALAYWLTLTAAHPEDQDSITNTHTVKRTLMVSSSLCLHLYACRVYAYTQACTHVHVHIQ